MPNAEKENSKPAAKTRARGKKTSSQPPSPGSMTEDEILKYGEEAAQLLNAPVYNIAHKMALDSLVDSWLQTADNETQKRESLWLQAQLLGLTAGMLLEMVNAAQNINMSEEEKAEQDLNRFLDEQGFVGDGPLN